MSTLNEDVYLGSMAYQALYSTAVDHLELKYDSGAMQQLRAALRQADQKSPGFLLELTKQLVERAGLEQSIDLHQSFLRLHANAPTDDLQFAPAPSSAVTPDPAYEELSTRAIALRKVLARVPDEMGDRRTFLETIKEIASSIKKLLDATNAVLQVIPPEATPSVEKRKREFVHYSKRFSNTLKEYFKDQNAHQVAVSANQLIYKTTDIVKTVRERTKPHQMV